MEKPDTTDLYKFFATLGIIIIVASLFSFWTILNTNDIFLHTEDELNNLTAIAKDNITSKQNSLSCLYDFSYWILFLSLILGFLLLCYGVYKWKRKQDIIDYTEKWDYEELMNKVNEQSPAQKEKKLESDIVETSGEEYNANTYNEISIDYKGIEEKVYKILKEKYKSYIIRNNVIFENIEFDVVMFPHFDALINNIFCIEVKYYSKNIKTGNLIRGYNNFANSINRFQKYLVKQKTKNNLKNLLIWVYNSNDQLYELNKNKNKLESIENSLNEKINIIIINKNDIEELVLIS